MSPAPNEIGNAITKAREELEISQAELARRLKCWASEVWRWEAGKTTPTIDTLREIANALDCELKITLEPRKKRRSAT